MPIGMQSSKEQQGDIRKPSSAINAKKQRKTIEWERLNFFKKIRDNKGTFHAKMSTIKDRNGMDLTEAEDIKKTWQEYTEELHKKDSQDPDKPQCCDHSPRARHLECNVKCVLGSITTNKASGGDGIPVELF